MGEFLAAHLFEAHGIEAVHVDRDGADLWVQLPDGRLAAVSVKAATRAVADDHRRTPRYHFNHRRRAGVVNFYGFVALDRRVMVVLPASRVSGSTSKIPEAAMTEEAMVASIKGMVDEAGVS